MKDLRLNKRLAKTRMMGNNKEVLECIPPLTKIPNESKPRAEIKKRLEAICSFPERVKKITTPYIHISNTVMET